MECSRHKNNEAPNLDQPIVTYVYLQQNKEEEYDGAEIKEQLKNKKKMSMLLEKQRM